MFSLELLSAITENVELKRQQRHHLKFWVYTMYYTHILSLPLQQHYHHTCLHHRKRNNSHPSASFGVSTVTLLKIHLWDVMPHQLVNSYWHFKQS